VKHPCVVVILLLLSSVAFGDTLVIAHRGASAYLPEHTLPAVAMAHAMGADYIEQDVVLTKDDKIVVLHDITLDHTTDVARVFPGRTRDDGMYYAIDFTLAEIKTLRVHERRSESGQAVFPNRFPIEIEVLRVPTLAEEIELISGMNASTGRDVGIHVELKNPGFHDQEGKDFPSVVLEELEKYGFVDEDQKAFVQCFDAETLKGLREHTELRLIQLLDGNALPMANAEEISGYAQGVGFSIRHFDVAAEFTRAAQGAGLQVQPYTFFADLIPPYADSFTELLDLYIGDLGVEGLFTDNPDLVRQYLDERH